MNSWFQTMTTLLIPLVKIECKDQFILKFGN